MRALELRGFPCGSSGKEDACQCRRWKRCGFDPWIRKISWSRKWRLTSVFLPEKFHGQGSLVDYSPWGRKESDITEWLNMRTCTGSRALDFGSCAAAAAKSLQSCLSLCDPIDGSPPGSPVPGILQARTLEWVAISFSNAWKWKVKVKSLSGVRLFATP